MQRLILLSALILLAAPSHNGQSIQPEPTSDDNVALRRLVLLSDLQALETESKKLGEPLARALAKTEIADTAWLLDQIWAQKLLCEAYELTLPSEEIRVKLRDRPIGSAPTISAGNDVARNKIRNRVLAIASRDKSFLYELAQFGAQQLGKQEEHYGYASLADSSIASGETGAAGDYILRAIEADPTILNAGIVIFDIASRDRTAADKLIIQYIERLRAVPLSQTNNSAWRIYLFLRDLVSNRNNLYLGFTNNRPDAQSPQMAPAGPAVMKAYVNFVVESLGRLEQIEPGSAKRFRGFLLSTWLPLNQYAPELTGSFLALEKLSRIPGQDASLPQPGNEDASKVAYEKRVKDSLESAQPDDLAINFAISRRDFSTARKMIDRLPDGDQKAYLTESVNTQEAIVLAAQGKTVEAESLAQRLNRAASIVQVYPLIIDKCVKRRDQSCAIYLVYQAISRLKRAKVEPDIPQSLGNLRSKLPSNQELDPLSLALSRLAKAVAPINETLALEVLDEAVLAANNSNLDTGQGRIGLEVDIFRKLARNNDSRVRQAAGSLKDPLRQIVTLAVIYRWRAEDITKNRMTN